MNEKDDSLVLWEGEWLMLRKLIGSARSSICAAANSLSSRGELRRCETAAQDTFRKLDKAIVEGGTQVMDGYRRRKWIAPALGIAAVSGFVFVRSSPRGLYIGTRNMCIAATLLTIGILPQETQTALSSILMTRHRFISRRKTEL